MPSSFCAMLNTSRKFTAQTSAVSSVTGSTQASTKNSTAISAKISPRLSSMRPMWKSMTSSPRVE